MQRGGTSGAASGTGTSTPTITPTTLPTFRARAFQDMPMAPVRATTTRSRIVPPVADDFNTLLNKTCNVAESSEQRRNVLKEMATDRWNELVKKVDDLKATEWMYRPANDDWNSNY